MTQNARDGVISRVGVSPFADSICGNGGKFCDANRSIPQPPPGVIAEGLGGNAGEGAAALGDAEEGVETGGAAWFGWGMHVSDSRLALGRGGFRFSDL